MQGFGLKVDISGSRMSRCIRQSSAPAEAATINTAALSRIIHFLLPFS